MYDGVCALPQVNRRSNTRHDKAHLWGAAQINGFNSAHNLATMYLCVARAEQRRRHLSVIACMECNYPARGNSFVSAFLCQICSLASLSMCSVHCTRTDCLSADRHACEPNEAARCYVRQTVHYKKETGHMCLWIFRSKFYNSLCFPITILK